MRLGGVHIKIRRVGTSIHLCSHNIQAEVSVLSSNSSIAALEGLACRLCWQLKGRFSRSRDEDNAESVERAKEV